MSDLESMSNSNEGATLHGSPTPSVTNKEKSAEVEPVNSRPQLDLEAGIDLKKHPSKSTSPFNVRFEENDPENPRNWTTRHKIFITAQLTMLAFSASMGSSIISPANPVIARYTHISDQISLFTVALYLLGFAAGPIIWAPISEIWGRRLSMLPAMLVFSCFSLGTASSRTAAQVLVTRFFSGFFASAPVSNVSAAMGDLYEPYHRGTAISLYAVAVVGGPTLGPIIGSALTYTVTWRWTEYLESITVFSTVVFTFFMMPEMYAPVILMKKAKRMRKELNDDRYHYAHEVTIDFSSIVTKYLSRPLRMLFTEPTVIAIAIYASFVYAILYMSLEWVPIIFEDLRGWGPIVGTIPFVSLLIGIIAALGINLGNQHYYHKVCARKGVAAVPEARLPPMMIGSFLFAGGLFWLAWTATPDHHWILPCFALAFIGAGFNSIFQQCINFLVDTYSIYAASAVAANTVLRSFLAAGLPFAVQPMRQSLGVPISLSVLGAIAGACIPLPFIFAVFGARLRSHSHFATD